MVTEVDRDAGGAYFYMMNMMHETSNGQKRHCIMAVSMKACSTIRKYILLHVYVSKRFQDVGYGIERLLCLRDIFECSYFMFVDGWACILQFMRNSHPNAYVRKNS
mmetsp:Transcript_4411/g.6425  ORF Transcript_4411/g.6425 Transcript_4411/m.6425 type:complete len:106 (-) Transcript_4411:55-372(-)